MSNAIIKKGNYFYFNSKNVKIFPSSYRGFYGDNNTFTFDPEARLNTEYNLVSLASKAYGAKSSYIIEYTAANNEPNHIDLLKCIIGGYYFELSNFDLTDLVDGNQILNLHITTKQIYLKDDLTTINPNVDADRATFILDSWEDTTAGVLDFKQDNSTYLFTGIRLSPDDASTNQDLALIKKQDNKYIIDPESFMPNNIYHGSGDGSLKFNNEDCEASGIFSVAFGGTQTSGNAGGGPKAKGMGSFAHGELTQAEGNNSHAEGFKAVASGTYAHAEGVGNGQTGDSMKGVAKGQGTHSEGYFTIAQGNYSHAEGSETITYGEKSHSEGDGTITGKRNDSTKGLCAHAEGTDTVAEGTSSHAEGKDTKAIEEAAHSEGYKTKATGKYAHAEGQSTGSINNAAGQASHSEGYKTVATGNYSHAEGKEAAANAESSHAEGYKTSANGLYAHAEGANSIAGGEGAHAEGYQTKATGKYSHAEGYQTEANGNYSHAEGVKTIANTAEQTVVGTYNEISLGEFVVGTGSLKADPEHEGETIEARKNSLIVNGDKVITRENFYVQDSSKTNFATITTSNAEIKSKTITLKSTAGNEQLNIANRDIKIALSSDTNEKGKITLSKTNTATPTTTATIGADTVNINATTLNSNNNKTVSIKATDELNLSDKVKWTKGIDGESTDELAITAGTSSNGAHIKILNPTNLEGSLTVSDSISAKTAEITSGKITLKNDTGEGSIVYKTGTKESDKMNILSTNGLVVTLGDNADSPKNNHVYLKAKNGITLRTTNAANSIIVDGSSGTSPVSINVGNNSFKFTNNTIDETNFGIDIGGKDLGRRIKDMLLNLLYPVGAIYTSVIANGENNTYRCPVEDTLGGTWVQIKNTFLYAAADDDAVNSTWKYNSRTKQWEFKQYKGNNNAVVPSHTHAISDSGHSHSVSMDPAGSHLHPLYVSRDYNDESHYHSSKDDYVIEISKQQFSRLNGEYSSNPITKPTQGAKTNPYYHALLENNTNNWNNDNMSKDKLQGFGWAGSWGGSGVDRLMDWAGRHTHTNANADKTTTGISVQTNKTASGSEISATDANMPQYVCAFMWQRVK